MRKILCSGKAELTRYRSVPHVEQKELVILLPEAIERDWLKAVRLARPRRCFRCVLATVKLDANMDAVILRQSEQLQTKVLIRPGPWVGFGCDVRSEEIDTVGGRRKRGRELADVSHVHT